jgi:hypothetical protein
VDESSFLQGFNEGYEDCKTELRDLMSKASMKSAEARLAIILAFLLREEDLNEM